MTATHVIFYRNMNLGHAGSPDRASLERALTDAGAYSARSFQTNGTVVVQTEEPAAVLAGAAPNLKASFGYSDAGIVCALPALVELLGGDPFDGYRNHLTYRETVTFFHGGRPLALRLPWTCPKGDVDLIAVFPGVALGIIRKEKSSAGSPTAEIERLTGGVATTRTYGTLQRLLASTA